jgi:hypothetical protein
VKREKEAESEPVNPGKRTVLDLGLRLEKRSGERRDD